MRLHDLSLAARVTIGVLSIVAAGTATFLLVENARLRDVYLSERRTHLEHDLETEKLRLNHVINTLRQDALFLSNTPPISGIVRASLNHGYDARDGDTRARWEKRLFGIFSAFSIAHPDYYKIRFIGVADGGREIVRIDNRGGGIEITPSDRLQAKGGRDFFKATLGLREGQAYLSEFNLNQEWGVIEQPYRPTLRATTPVFTPSGEIFGIVVINMDVDNLLKLAVSDLPGVQTYMANSDGQYLIHPDSGQAFKFELGSKDSIATDFYFIKTMFNPQAPDYLPLQAAATKPGSPLFAARRIRFDPGNPQRFLLLMHYLPAAVVAEQVATITVDTILYEFMVMLLVGGIATLALRRTFSPLKQITAAADKIAAGDQNTLLLPADGGEIGSLTSALNAMLTRLSQREKLLQESETRYRRLHESMVDAYVMVDMSGRLLEFNHTYREMLGYSAGELLRLTCVELTPEKWHEFEARIIEEQVIPRGYSQVYEKEYIRKDGTVFPVEFKAFLLRDKNNQPEAMWAIVRDITERKQAESELLRQKEFFRQVIDADPSLIFVKDAEGRLLLANQAIATLYGLTPDEMLGEKYLAQLKRHGSEAELYLEMDREVIRKRQPVSLVHPSSLGGEERWFLTSKTPMELPDGTVNVLGISVDITERKRAEDLLRKSSGEIEGLYNHAPCGYHSLDKDGVILMINDTELAWLGYTRDEVIGKMKWTDLLTPTGLQTFRETFPQLMEQGFVRDIEAGITRKDGTVLEGLINAIAIYDLSGNYVKSRSTVADITGHKRMEQQLRDLAAHLQAVREEEKAGIAREIHDDLGGTLAALKMETYWLKTELSANEETAPLLGHVGEMSQLIDNAVGVMRRIITGLRPTILDDLGLLAAIEWQAAQFHKRTGIECRINCVCATSEEGAKELDEPRSIALFRICQEALVNVARHSGASMVEIEFLHSDQEVVMSIIDNGRGMTENRTDASIPYGMLGMRERAEQLGGKINLDTTPGGGLSVTAILPLPVNEMEET